MLHLLSGFTTNLTPKILTNFKLISCVCVLMETLKPFILLCSVGQLFVASLNQESFMWSEKKMEMESFQNPCGAKFLGFCELHLSFKQNEVSGNHFKGRR